MGERRRRAQEERSQASAAPELCLGARRDTLMMMTFRESLGTIFSRDVIRFI
jgi:hypothetical protein